MSLKAINLERVKNNVSNPKVWIVIGVSVAGILILTAETRRRRLKGRYVIREDYGAFIERFELLPFPQPPPPAAKQPLSGLNFAVSDVLVYIYSSINVYFYAFLNCFYTQVDHWMMIHW